MKAGSYHSHPPMPECRDECVAARASQRLYGDRKHEVGQRGMARQRLLDVIAMQTPTGSRFEPLNTGVHPPFPLSNAELERRFTYHWPEGPKVVVHDDIRVHFKVWSRLLNDRLPIGREAALAFTALEEASFWAHAAIAREGK